MARLRTIKPEVMDDEKSAGLSSDAWRLWVCLWMLADDKGRARANPDHLRSRVFWAWQRHAAVADLLEELSARGCIVRYTVKGEPFAQVVNFAKHQKIDNPSRWENPPPSSDSANLPAFLGEDSGSTQRALPEGSALEVGIGVGEEIPASRVASEPKHPAEESPKQPSDLPPLLKLYCDRWVEAFKPEDGKPPKLTKGDIKSADTLLRSYGLAEASKLVLRFLSDGDKFIAGRGHVLRDIHQRVNGYRAVGPNSNGNAAKELTRRNARKYQ